MGKTLAALLAASAVLAFSGSVPAAEPYPTQEATATTTVTNPEGQVIREDTVSETTKGADTTMQYKEMKSQEMKSETMGEEKPAAPIKKKKMIHKKTKKSKAMTEAAPQAAGQSAPEAK